MLQSGHRLTRLWAVIGSGATGRVDLGIPAPGDGGITDTRAEGVEKPEEPLRDVEIAVLGCLEVGVVRGYARTIINTAEIARSTWMIRRTTAVGSRLWSAVPAHRPAPTTGNESAISFRSPTE